MGDQSDWGAEEAGGSCVALLGAQVMLITATPSNYHTPSHSP